MSKFLQLARRFEMKLVLAGEELPSGKPPINYDAAKKQAELQIKKLVSHMADVVKKSRELREAAFTFPQDPLIELGDKARQGSDDCKQIMSGILFLDNNSEKLSIDEMIKPLLSIDAAIRSLVDSSGSDKWGISRNKFLNAVEIFGDYYTTQGGYGDRTRLDPMAKRDLEAKVGKLTDTFHSLAIALRNARRTGALDILSSLSKHGLVKDVELDQSSQSTHRIVRNLESHEKEMILREFSRFLGFSSLNLMPTAQSWDKYVRPIPGVEKLLSDVFRAWLRGEEVGKRELREGEMIGPALKGKNRILSRTTVDKLNMAATSIAENKQVVDAKEKMTSEKMFGTPPPLNKIKPKKDMRQIIESLGATERALWSKIPVAIQMKIYNQQIDLDSALELAQGHADQMTGAKLDANLFSSLESTQS